MSMRPSMGFVRTGKPVWSDYNDQFHCREFELYPILDPSTSNRLLAYPGRRITQIRQKVRSGFSMIVATGMACLHSPRSSSRGWRATGKNYRVAAIHGDPAGIGKAQSDKTTMLRHSAKEWHPRAASFRSNDPTLRMIPSPCAGLHSFPSFHHHARLWPFNVSRQQFRENQTRIHSTFRISCI